MFLDTEPAEAFACGIVGAAIAIFLIGLFSG